MFNEPKHLSQHKSAVHYTCSASHNVDLVIVDSEGMSKVVTFNFFSQLTHTLALENSSKGKDLKTPLKSRKSLLRWLELEWIFFKSRFNLNYFITTAYICESTNITRKTILRPLEKKFSFITLLIITVKSMERFGSILLNRSQCQH